MAVPLHFHLPELSAFEAKHQRDGKRALNKSGIEFVLGETTEGAGSDLRSGIVLLRPGISLRQGVEAVSNDDWQEALFRIRLDPGDHAVLVRHQHLQRATPI